MKSRTGFLISQIKQVQDRVFQRILQDFGIEEFNGPQGRILYVLWQKDEVPIVELSAKTGLAKNTLTAMLARMEEGGLLERKASSTDKRQCIIVLTAKARKLKDKYDEVSEQMNILFFDGFSQEEVTLLDSRLGRILQNLEQAEREYKKQTQE